MHDPRHLLEPSAEAVRRLARRGHRLDLDELGKLVAHRAEAVGHRDRLRAQLKELSRTVGAHHGQPPAAAAGTARGLKEGLRAADAELRAAESALEEVMLRIPNLPADEVPDGTDEDPAREVRRWGARPDFDFAPRDHVDLGTRAGILDLQRAGRLSGARFAVLRGAGAALERALTSFLLDLHTREHGYVEYSVPHLVTRQAMTGTGQLPKFADDLFATRVAERELFLIPTAEVPLVNLFQQETLNADELPLALTAHTSCFRSEAGSYGRDTRGLVRLHEFAKVELVRICPAEEAAEQLRLLTAHAEDCLRRLGLHYRVVELRAGDLGFSARRTYDLEVWLPGQDSYREISSVSDCGTFQGRRAGVRVRRGGRKEFAATLNGSGLPVGRTVVALLEQNQRRDGSVTIPPALVPYTGFREIAADGRPVD
ncbi:serine--tRNA ligase [Streptomyces alanosinicus]|uniref:Serine--tRNA ligase n=1 Tax=Streptomyces alanosinicus TaxID=68171 RepID=A0A918YTB6_9ACTN|nr:serine--tRNA ligase [Streptomyces alanosinicus]GHE16146.1 serine--tRNA ligase [Streptomyces alanosinicus]